MMQRTLDLLAISISGLCALHCLLMPLALVLFPILSGTFFAGEDFHLFLVWVILPTSAIALMLGCKRHKDTTVLAIGTAGILLLILSALWGHDLLGEWGERLLTVIAGIILAVSHVRNYRLCQQDSCQHDFGDTNKE